MQLSTQEGSASTFQVTVQNNGARGGGCTILSFWRPLGHLQPLRQKLFGFDGVRVRAGGSAVLKFELKADHFAVANEEGHQIVRQGPYEVFFKGAGEILRVPVTVSGPERTVARFAN